jgi:hypothetical protein
MIANFDGNSATLTVEDHGTGIEPVDLPHLFDPFFRSARARLRGQPGFGSAGLSSSALQHVLEPWFRWNLSREMEAGSSFDLSARKIATPATPQRLARGPAPKRIRLSERIISQGFSSGGNYSVSHDESAA